MINIDKTEAQKIAPIYSHWTKAAERLLTSLKKNNNARLFLRPVDPIKDGVPDYFDFIKHPMDLGTIEEKLESNAFIKPSDLQADLNLMFENCFFYNTNPNLYVHQAGKSLRELCERQWKELHLDWYETGKSSSTDCMPY